MEKRYESEFGRKYNRVCGSVLRAEREKRKISLDNLAGGILSGTALKHMETGRRGWRKAAGDTLMNRMGIAADFFEIMACSDELERWRAREDICLLVPARPEEAGEKIREYRQRYGTREPLEEQFLLKAEVLLRLLDREKGPAEKTPAELLETAKKAVSCTVKGDWERGLDRLWLAPGELEAILLAAAVWMACGQNDRAWELQQAVWNYPGAHQWKERVTMLIMPQAALLGMRLELRRGNGRRAFRMGRDAIELLRSCCCHCYLLPLLEAMEGIPTEDPADREYQEQISGFRQAFETLYRKYGYPAYRIWQGISVDNAREAGTTLRMLRKFYDKPRAKAVYDGEEKVVTERQLEKIEKGIHKPSHENYRRLMKQYGKYGGWEMAMVETTSADVLELRQQIATLVGLCKWEEVKSETERFREMTDESCPRVKQELLFWDALIKWKGNDVTEGTLELLKEALHCTVPDFEGRDKRWWVFQREEIMIAANVADVYRYMGKMEEAEEWFKTAKFSLEQQKDRVGIMPKGYAILMDNYDNYLGDAGRFDDALKMNEEAVQEFLKAPLIGCMASMLYRVAWNSYEIASRDASCLAMLQVKWQDSFQLSEALADFMYDSELQRFLKDRRDKYLLFSFSL